MMRLVHRGDDQGGGLRGCVYRCKQWRCLALIDTGRVGVPALCRHLCMDHIRMSSATASSCSTFRLPLRVPPHEPIALYYQCDCSPPPPPSPF